MDKEEVLRYCEENQIRVNGEIVEDYKFGWMEDDGDLIKLIMCPINKIDDKCPCMNDKIKFKAKLGKMRNGMHFWNMYENHVETRKTLQKRWLRTD